MKALLTILILISSLHSFATEWLTYYVYFETEYLQGPWTRSDILEQSGYKYLAAEAYEDLFGSSEEQLADKFIARLKDKKPGLYDWQYDLDFKNDTVIITTKERPRNTATIKNEITATLTFNSFSAVTFNFGNSSETLTNKDLTLPYFDLVTQQAKVKTDTIKVRAPAVPNSTAAPKAAKKPLATWLILSIILNAGLMGWCIVRSIKRQKT